MKLYGLDADGARAALGEANRPYAGNLDFNRFEPKRTHIVFTLRVKDSKAPGHRRGHSGRRMVAACWHAHRDFMRAVFDAEPSAKIVSCMARYDGQEDFELKHGRTATQNIGSVMQPLCMADACDC